MGRDLPLDRHHRHARLAYLRLDAQVKKQKMPRDPMQRAKLTIDLATGAVEPEPERVKDPASVELGRQGGLIGGKRRAAKLSPERRQEIARQAARKRWGSPQS